ncbi:MAG: ABC transporter permease, partial [Rhodomicrobium sp.]|nr:ABC transporter permease [Rhodomicrobium sp.]
SGDKVEQVPLPETLDKAGLKRNIEATMKRLAPGALRTVALVTPPPNPMAQFGQGGDTPSFQLLDAKLRENAAVEATDLREGRVPEQADILMIAAPEALDEKQLFAIDQFLMKGGTVVIAASPLKTSIRGNLDVTPAPTGLEDWLAFNGIGLDKSLVLDPQSTPFPVPVERNVGGFRVQQIQLVDYPFFVDIRQDGMPEKKAPTIGLSQLTLSWASPLKIDEEKAKGRKVTKLIESSPESWVSNSHVAVPDFKAHPKLGFEAGDKRGRQLLGAMMEGEFKSFFAGKPSPLAKDAAAADADKDKPADAANAQGAGPDKADGKDKKPTITGVIERSPESARIILVGSSTFLTDDVLNLTSSINQTQYLAPLSFAQNAVEWSLEDRGLLALRSRGGQFSRTLEPMTAGGQALLEYLNYGLALLGLAIVYLVRRVLRQNAKRRYLTMLGIEGA